MKASVALADLHSTIKRATQNTNVDELEYAIGTMAAPRRSWAKSAWEINAKSGGSISWPIAGHSSTRYRDELSDLGVI